MRFLEGYLFLAGVGVVIAAAVTALSKRPIRWNGDKFYWEIPVIIWLIEIPLCYFFASR